MNEKEFRLRNSPPAAGRASGIFLSTAVRSPRSVFYFIGALSYETKNSRDYPGCFLAGYLTGISSAKITAPGMASFHTAAFFTAFGLTRRVINLDYILSVA